MTMITTTNYAEDAACPHCESILEPGKTPQIAWECSECHRTWACAEELEAALRDKDEAWYEEMSSNYYGDI